MDGLLKLKSSISVIMVSVFELSLASLYIIAIKYNETIETEVTEESFQI